MINKKLVIGVLILFSIFFSGCSVFSGDETPEETPTENERTRIINDEKYPFTIIIPREWDIIEEKDFTSEVPEETLVVFRNNIKNEDFTANVNIIQSPLQTEKETLEYAKQVLNRQSSGLYNYNESKRDLTKMKIGNNEVDTYFTVFEAKKDAKSSLIRFIQTYAVKGNFAYTVTGSVSINEDSNNIKIVEDIVKSFRLK